MKECPVCQSSHLVDTIHLPEVPIYCNVLWPTSDQALDAAKGDIDLSYCEDCGHVFNRSFDPDLMDYTEAYENSLHFSPLFNEYANNLANRLIDKYSICEKDIVEIGCGKGDFLSMLCSKGNNRGFGFDKSVEQDRDGIGNVENITFINDFYDESYAHQNVDFMVCRHVLEHIQQPLEFLTNIRKTLESHANPVVYFEVPNVLYTLKDLGIWDLIYEHCAYFSPTSLESVFRMAGFTINEVGESFGGQFLYIEAQPGSIDGEYQIDQAMLAELSGYVNNFEKNYNEKVTSWNKKLASVAEKGHNAVIWGGGSKGVTFLNTVRSKNRIQSVVDLNPHKHQMFVPGSAQQVIPPEALQQNSPQLVIVMNSIYKDEIGNSLSSLKINSELVCV